LVCSAGLSFAVFPFSAANPTLHGTTPPTITITSPSAAGNCGTTVPVYATVDAGAYVVTNVEVVSTMHCWLDGEDQGEISGIGCDTAPFTGFFTCELSDVREGVHNLTLAAVSSWENEISAQTTFVVDTSAPVETPWTLKTPPSSACNHLCVINGDIYDLEGSALYGVTLQIYNPTTDKWTQRTCQPLNQEISETVAVNSKIYTMKSDFEARFNYVYDLGFDTWTAKTPIPMSLSDFRLTVLGDKIYATGRHWSLSQSGQSYTYEISQPLEVYNPASDSWTALPAVPTMVTDYVFAALNGKLYIIGGTLSAKTTSNQVHNTNTGITNKFVQVFDTKINQWTQIALPNAITSTGCCSTTTSNRIYLVNATGTQIYDPETNRWTQGAPIPTRTNPAQLVNVNNKLYALGGNYNLNLLYVTPTDTANSTPSLTATTSTDSSLVPSTTSTVQADPSPSVPEFPAWVILPVIVGIAIAAVNRRKKQQF
jgi:hypothetical protein